MVEPRTGDVLEREPEHALDKSCYCEGRASIIGLSWLDGRYCPIYQITFTFKQTAIPYHHWMWESIELSRRHLGF